MTSGEPDYGASHVRQSLNEKSSSAVRRFVRGTLGCSCPDEVFETIDVVKSPPWFEGLPGDYLLAIGNRLLVLVISTRRWEDVLQDLEELFLRGRELRDTEGFNRFRLVVATPDVEAARPVLMAQFDSLSHLDKRLHLHVILTGGLQGLGFT